MLPNDLKLEEAILGYFLCKGNEAEDIFITLEVEYFYNNNIKKIIEVIYKMFLEGEGIEFMTVCSKIENEEFFKRVGGRSYLVDLTEDLDKIANIEDMINSLKETRQRRELVIEARNMESFGMKGKDIEENINKSFENINKILMEGESRTTDTESNIKMVEKYIEENKNKKLIGYSWGVGWLDYFSGGIRKGKTYRIGGLSGSGKTSLVYQIINNLIKNDVKVLFISLENTIEMTLVKFLSTEQECNPREIEKGNIGANFEFLRKYKNNFILTDKLNGLNEIKREVLKVKPDVVILDYLGLVEIKGFDERSKYDKYADEIRHFIQKNQSIAWIDLSNLNKSETEDTIRLYGGFNGSAKLRNNVDFALHIFPFQPFNNYKKDILENGTDEAKKLVLGKKVNTFLISKSRLGDDGVEKQFIIDFNKGTKYYPAKIEQIEKWNNLI